MNGLKNQVLSFLYQAVTFLKKCFKQFDTDKIDQLTNRANMSSGISRIPSQPSLFIFSNLVTGSDSAVLHNFTISPIKSEISIVFYGIKPVKTTQLMVQLVTIMNEPEPITPYTPEKQSFSQIFPAKFVNKWRKDDSFVCNKQMSDITLCPMFSSTW